MLKGIIQIQVFGYQVIDTEGQVSGKTIPMKILDIQDNNSGMRFQLSFTVPEFEQFLQNIQGKKILSMAVMPKIEV